MGSAFIKAIKWAVLFVFVIGGIYGLVTASEQSDIKPVMISVLCFGSVYMMFKSWSDLPGKVMIASAVVVVILAFFAQDQYVPYWVYRYTGENLQWGFYQIWAALVASIGTLVMVIVFLKFGDDD